jgi:predicted RND superfamily exporter protein
VVLPLIVTATSLVWTIGAYAMCGFALNTITSLLPPVVMVLSVATSVHVIAGWYDSMRRLGDRDAAICATIDRLHFPCMFTALTTAIGFAALLLSATPAVRLFGVFAAFGVLTAFGLGMTLVPVLLSFSYVGADLRSTRGGWVSRALAATARGSTDRPRLVLAVGIAVVLPALAAIPSIRNNTDLIGFLKADSTLRLDTTWIDEHFGPVLSFEALIERRDGQPLEKLEDLARLDAFGAQARRIDGVRRVAGPVEILSQLQRGETGESEPSLPDHQADADYLFELIDANQAGVVGAFISTDRTSVRVNIGLGAMGTLAGTETIDRLRRVADESLGNAYVFQLTCAFYQVAVGSQEVVRSQVVTFALALVLVLIAIGFEFRSLAIVVAAAIPNVLPLLLTAGVMAGAGIDLSTGTAMIASVVIGLAVDDTIHYLARFRDEYDGDARAAVRATTESVGRVLVMTSIVLVFGFWVGVLGSFMPTVHFSFLSGTTMLFALLYDLLVLPAGLQLLVSKHAARVMGNR